MRRIRRSLRAVTAALGTGVVLLGAGIAAPLPGSPLPAAHALPSGFTDSEVVPTTFTRPTSVDVLPGGRLLVLEQNGGVKLVRPDGSVATAATLPVCFNQNQERGLLSAALDPDFTTNGYVYLYRTTQIDGVCTNALGRFTLTGDVLDTGSELRLVDNIQWSASNHNGGTVEIGRDGYLYLSVGEGAQSSRAQSLASLGGKILRLTTAGQPAPGNPFSDAAGSGPCARLGQSATVCQEVFALGLRNPFRLAFDPNRATTRFRIDDVGQSSWEEVDDGIAGANYGWPSCEGPCSDPDFVAPITAYPRDTGAYIVGGAFVPDGWWGAAYDGAYLFADGGSNDMWLLPAGGTVDYDAPFADEQLSVAADLTFGTRNGERALFYVNNGNGELRKIVGPDAATTGADGPAYLGGPVDGTPSPTPPEPPEPTPPTPGPPVPEPLPGAYVYTALASAERVFDSRNGIGGPAGRVQPGASVQVALGVPAGTAAALVNLTLDNGAPTPEDACAPGSYLVAWQPGTPQPATSNANVGPCDVAANTSVVAVDDSGAITIEVSAPVDVIVDVLGTYSAATGAVAAGRFTALTPSRLIDTRQPAASANDYTRTDDGNTSLVRVVAAGRAGLPDGAVTAALTVTAIGPGSDAGGYVTAYAGGAAQPPTSTVNHSGNGDTRANLAFVPVGPDGTIVLYLYQVANVVVDVVGWITSPADPAGVSGLLHLAPPTRAADSRNGIGVPPLGPGGEVTLEPAGVPATATAVLQNVTMVSHAPGWICATPSPWSGGDVSIQNARVAGLDRPATTFTALGPGPEPRLRYCSQESADLIVDILGYVE